ncbi:hypothetical protein JCM8547_005639 [Rhodosporidiobolus lusitaniae]
MAEISPTPSSSSTTTTPASSTRALSPPRGAAGFGSLPSSSSSSTTAADKPTSRSPSRSRAPSPRDATGGLFSNIARSITRSVSRSRTSPVEGENGEVRSTSRGPRGAAGFGSLPSSREPSRGRGAAVGAGEESNERSRSRARQAMERIAELVGPRPEVIPDEQSWGMAGLTPQGRSLSRQREKGKGVEGERAESRGRRVEGGKENVRGESRARSLARSLMSGAAQDRTA